MSIKLERRWIDLDYASARSLKADHIPVTASSYIKDHLIDIDPATLGAGDDRKVAGYDNASGAYTLVSQIVDSMAAPGDTTKIPSTKAVVDFTADIIEFPNDGTATDIPDILTAINHIWSAGSVEGFNITDNLDGSVDISSGEVVLRLGTDNDSPLKLFAMASSPGLTPADGVSTIYYIDYNSGTPILTSTTDPYTINGRTQVPLHLVTRVATSVKTVDLRQYNVDYAQLNARQDFLIRGYEHVKAGSVVTETGTRNLDVTAGMFYILGIQQPHGAFDTSGVDTFTYVHQNGGGGWTRVAGETQIDNIKYDDGDGVLGDVTAGKYGIHWVFVILNEIGTATLSVMYGRAEYDTLSAAQDAKLPADLPPELSAFASGQLIAKVIIQRDASSFADIQSPFEVTLTSSTASVHNALGGLQGGTVLQYYHLTSAQQSYVSDITVSFGSRVVNYIQLDTTAGDPGYGEGRIWYDNVNKALAFYNDEADSTAQIPFESWFRGRNISGDTILNGSAVYIAPEDSGIPTLELAKADAIATTETLVGLMTHDIEDSSNGIVVTRGTLRGYDTQTPGWTSGQALWLSATVAGGLTNVRPSIPNRAIRVGVVGVVDTVNGTIEVSVGTPVTQSAEDIVFPNDGVATHNDNLAETINHIWSAASCDGFDITDNGNGTVDIASGEVVLRSANNSSSPLILYAVSGVAALAPTDNNHTFIYVRYNGGSPDIATTSDPNTIDGRTEVPIWLLTRVGNAVHSVDLREYSTDSPYRFARQSFYVGGFRHVPGGSVVTETGTRNLDVTAGSFYLIGLENTHPAFDTSAADTFTYVYQNGIGGWTRVTGQTQINNTNYDDGDGTLGLLTNNKYGVHWIFVVLNAPSELFVLYGRDNYASLSDARAATLPSNLPPELAAYSTGQLIAKVIIEKDGTTFADIQTPFESSLTSSTATSHNALGGLQGGTIDEYYHLTAANHGYVVSIDQDLGTTDSPTFTGVTSPISKPVLQALHGFATLDVIHNNAGAWEKAQADDPDTLGIAIVTAVADTSNFTYSVSGLASVPAHGLTVGDYYYLSAGTAGLLTDTEPTGITDLSNPIVYVVDSNTIFILPWRPTDAIPRSNDLKHTFVSTSTYNALDTDEFLLVDASGGPIQINLPTPSSSYIDYTLRVKKIDVSGNAVTIKCASGTIDLVAGSTGYSITGSMNGDTFVCDGVNYWIAP